MKKLSFLILLLPLFSLSQNNNSNPDSVRFYSRELNKLRRQADDSLRASVAYQQALAGIKRHRRKSNDYAGFVFLSGIVHSDFTSFNQSLSQSGFSRMKALSSQFGFGTSTKSGSTILDFYFFAGALDTKSNKGDEKILFNSGNLLQFDLGFDLLRSKIISLYPFVGLSLKETSLTYKKPIQLNTSFTNISNLVVNDQSVELNSTRLGYQAGLGFDIVLGENKKHTTNKVLFIKGGTNRSVGKERYSFHGLKYDPHIKSGDWVVSFGIKFGNKN
jgi:hypothetical protein